MPSAPFGPLVSVCMPVFNGERYLALAIKSVLAQSYRNFELLIFDDQSTDGSWSLLQTFKDSRITLQRNPKNLGPGQNWDQGLAAARGAYIKIFHQDDLLAPDCLERQVGALERDHRAVLSFCSRAIIRPDGTKIMIRRAPWAEGLVGIQDVVRRCVIAGANLVGEPSAVLFRAEAARQVGGFDGDIPYLIDLDYWVRLLTLGRGYYLVESLASFRISPQQWSAAIGRRQGHEFCSFIDKLSASNRFQLNCSVRARGKIMARLNGRARGWVLRLMLR